MPALLVSGLQFVNQGRETSDPVPEVCYLESVNTGVMMLLHTAVMPVHIPPFSPSVVSGSMDEKRRSKKKKKVSSEIYNRDASSCPPPPHPPNTSRWCGHLVFCRIFWPPMVFPIFNSEGKNRELLSPGMENA